VIMIEIKDKKVESVSKENNIVQLFNNGEILGFNIFDESLFSSYADGFIYPEAKVLSELNAYLKENNLDYNFTYNKRDYLQVAEVLEVNKVEGSDNLSLCKVLVKDQEYSMICGASNVKVGMKTIAALDNALLSDGSKITSGEVLGVYSQGMLCSLKELGLDKDKKFEGIVELSKDKKVGTSFYDLDWGKEYV
ncbi:MAG TPA: hypothetical protein VFC83_00635, partial [Erysipelotrichaceae bacterium]|nr:hypothetical protein [Erysipelotrichaceae bacterium]